MYRQHYGLYRYRRPGRDGKFKLVSDPDKRTHSRNSRKREFIVVQRRFLYSPACCDNSIGKIATEDSFPWMTIGCMYTPVVFPRHTKGRTLVFIIFILLHRCSQEYSPLENNKHNENNNGIIQISTPTHACLQPPWPLQHNNVVTLTQDIVFIIIVVRIIILSPMFLSSL